MENGNCNKSADAQINVVIGTLLDSAADKNESVSYAVNIALRKIAKYHPNELLKTVCTYRQRNAKLSHDHIAAMIEPLEEVCQEHIMDIDGDTVLLLIHFCVEEMTKTTEYIPTVQMSASAVLVALGKKHCIQVMEGLLKKFTIGTVPHYSIPHTMGALASANPFGVLPFLKNILGAMLPMLGMLRTDPLKQSFAYAIGRFSEAINEYMSNIENAPDPTIHKNMYTSEISIAYDLFCTSWIQSREPKLVETVLHALGSMFFILTPEKVAEQAPKMITTLIFMCKRQKDCYSLTQCLATVLLVILELNKTLLEQHLDALLNTLSDIIAPMPDYVRLETVKNQSEVLRCYDRIAKYFCDKTVDHLIQLLKSNNDKEKIRSLLVITHLVNSSDSVIKNRVNDFIHVLKQLINEHNIKVKTALLKTVVAFAYHGHFFNQEGNIFIEFIIRLCCTPNIVNSKGVPEMTDAEWCEVLRTCDNSLYLLTTSVLELENVFWCLFLECILNEEYTNASCTLLKCLTNLAMRKRERLKSEDYSFPNVPSPESIFARCLTLLVNPMQLNRGTYILNFLKNYSFSINKHLPALHDTEIPKLVKYLEERTDCFDSEEWEENVLIFLRMTIKDLDEGKWTEALIVKFTEQITLYKSNSFEKQFLLKCIATALCCANDVKFVKGIIDIMLGSARLNSVEEAHACGRAIAICSRFHLQPVITKLNTIRREELLKKSNKFLNFHFIKDGKHEIETEKLRYTIICCYAELVLEAQAEKLLLSIEHEILDWIVQELQTTKDPLIRHICVIAIDKIAEAMHPSRNSLHIRMQSRDEVLKLMLSQLQLHNGAEYIELIPVVIPVLNSLVKLRNDLEGEQRISIIKTCFDIVYGAAAIYCKLSYSSTNEISYGDLKLTPSVFKSFEKLNELVRTLLLQSVNPATLDDILTLIEFWLSKRKAEQRLPAIENLRSVLNCYLNNMKFPYGKFGQTGFILGRIIPRCTDPTISIRLVALESIRLTLCIASRYEGHMSDYNNEIGDKLLRLNEGLQTNDPKLLYSSTSEIAKVISIYLPQFQFVQFTESVMDGLLDQEPTSSSGTSVTLTVFFKQKGAELHQHVSDIVVNLLNMMNNITCTKTKISTVRCVLALAVHHPKSVVSILLTTPLPYDTNVSDCWMMLASEHALSSDILEQFKRIFSTIALYEEQQNAEKLKICTLQPLAAVCALHEMLKNSQIQELVISQLPELIAILLAIFSSYIGSSPPIYVPHQASKKDKYSIVPNREAYKLSTSKIALETLKLLLICSKQTKIAELFLQNTTLENSITLLPLIELMPSFVEGILQNIPNILCRTVTALNQYASSTFEPQRIVAFAFFVEVVKHKGNGQTFLVESVITTLLNGQTDESPMVRQLVLRGLGYVSNFDDDLSSRNSNFVFSALVQGLDDHELSNSDTNIPLEAMLSFSKMLNGVAQCNFESIQVSTAVRIKTFYEKEDPHLRAAAFRLFGDLAKSFDNNTRLEAFKEQISGNYISLLLHLSDEDLEVVKACKYALRRVSPFLGAKNINNMIQDHLIEEGSLHYSNFMSDFIKIMSEEIQEYFSLFLMNAISFLKSNWPQIRGNAALMVGILFTYLPSKMEANETVQLDMVCYRLMQLLQDEDAEVRAKAVQGLSYLFVM